MASNNTAGAFNHPERPEYQDCILCRLTGTAVFGMLSLGAFKEAWRLHRKGGQGGSAPAAKAASSSLGRDSAARTATGARATITRLIKAMEVFPAAAEASSEGPAATSSPPRATSRPAPTPASASATAASSSLRNVKAPATARVAFLVLAGIGFGGGAVWRAVMPANKPIPSSQPESNSRTSYGSRQG